MASGKPLRRVRRHMRRGALPSALIALVAFSFTLLGFGAAVYTATLPGLVAARSDGMSEGLLSSIIAGLTKEAPTSDADAAQQEDGAAAASEAPTAGAGGVSLGGISLEGIMGAAGSSDAQGEAGGQGQQGGSQDGGGSTGPSQPDTPSEPDSGSGSGDQGDIPDPTPEQVQEIYDTLLAKSQLIESYAAEVNACVSAFYEDCLNPSLDVRLARQRTCDALGSRLFSEYATLLNPPIYIQNTPYLEAWGNLVGMYRCLGDYSGTISEAWEINVSFEDPSAHVDEFMAPVYRDTVDGENKHLTEFRYWADRFEL